MYVFFFFFYKNRHKTSLISKRAAMEALLQASMMDKKNVLKEAEEAFVKSLSNSCPNTRLTVKMLKDVMSQFNIEEPTSEAGEMELADDCDEEEREDNPISVVGPAFNPKKTSEADIKMKNFQNSLVCKCVHVQEAMKMMQKLLTIKVESDVSQSIKNAIQCACMIDNDSLTAEADNKVRTTLLRSGRKLETLVVLLPPYKVKGSS